MLTHLSRFCTFLAVASALLVALGAVAQSTGEAGFQPRMGQPGKDVVWIPTPDAMVEKMLDMAHVTPQDFVIDLGSGDGRNVIAAARRGARALGVEFNPDLVEYSRRAAAAAGVADRARFVQGDMYEADISQATVLALFLQPDNLQRLQPKFLALKPGARIVSNTYGMSGGWMADETETVREACTAFCLAALYIVPARVAGYWRMPDGNLTLQQEFQKVSGTFELDGITVPVEDGRLRGEEIRFTVNGVEYTGRVSGERMEGTARGRISKAWNATRVQ